MLLDVYEQAYEAGYPVVCLDESPKQVLKYQEFTRRNGQRCQGSEYVRHGVVEVVVATEPLRGWRDLTVEPDHQAATWVQVVARLLDTTYRGDAKKMRWVRDNFSTHKRHFF